MENVERLENKGRGKGQSRNLDDGCFHSKMRDEVGFILQEFEVTLTKGDKGLGFTVAGGQTAAGFFYVKEVLYDPALKDGRIQKGDRLLRVRVVSLLRLLILFDACEHVLFRKPCSFVHFSGEFPGYDGLESQGRHCLPPANSCLGHDTLRQTCHVFQSTGE